MIDAEKPAAIAKLMDEYNVPALPPAFWRALNKILAEQPVAPAQGGAAQPTEAQIDAAARVIWDDRDARMGGPWTSRDPDEVVVVQTRATARAALIAAARLTPAEGEDIELLRKDAAAGWNRCHELAEELRQARAQVENDKDKLRTFPEYDQK